jgi:DNA-damage-inducible protein D
MQCWNTEGIFRLLQSIPSPKAEPFKRWLARVGKERIDEIENPELAMSRMQEVYETRALNPSLQSFSDWLRANRERIPVPA